MESRATATASLPGIARCAWRELDVSAVIGMRLHPAYRPCDWDSHQYANEVWLDRALQAQPSGDGTSVVYLANHGLSLWCYREITSRRLGLRDITSLTSLAAADRLTGRACAKGEGQVARAWNWRAVRAHLQQMELASADDLRPEKLDILLTREPENRAALWHLLAAHPIMRNASVPKVLPFANTECVSPWQQGQRQAVGLGEDMLVLSSKRGANRLFDVTVPLNVNGPAWLIGDAPAPAIAWAARTKLLFFAGHTPKLYLSRLRYNLFRKLSRHPANATALSSTINCTVGAYEVCSSAERVQREYRTFCLAPCRRPTAKRVCAPSAQALLRQCRNYHGLEFSSPAFRAALATASRALPRPEFLALAAQHKFFLVSPGDPGGFTPKLTEAVALGGAAGTIPVLVFFEQWLRKGDERRYLPYGRWLDWCSIAYVVSDRTAHKQTTQLLDALASIPPADIARKQASLRAVWPAFVVRSRERGPSAPDYMLGEACLSAERFVEHSRLRGGRLRGGLGRRTVANGNGPNRAPRADLTRCTFRF